MSIEEQAVTSSINLVFKGAEASVRVVATTAATVMTLMKMLNKIIDKEKVGSKLTKGENKIKKMLATGNCEIFTISQSQLKEFGKRCKDFGVSYSVMGKKEKDGHYDGKVDIIIQQKDAQIVNHIIEAFKFDTLLKEATIENDNPLSELELEKAEKTTIADEFQIKDADKEDNEINPKTTKEQEVMSVENQSKSNSDGKQKNSDKNDVINLVDRWAENTEKRKEASKTSETKKLADNIKEVKDNVRAK